MVYNNLGGQGPGHLDDPLELRFADTASMRPDGSHGQRVDVAWGTQGMAPTGGGSSCAN